MSNRLSVYQGDGGSAFPHPDPQGPGPHAVLGMSLRDYFAGCALQGMNARDSYDYDHSTPQLRARLAYIEADAMLAQREDGDS